MSASTLTDRYVREVVRRVPAGQRAELADELRTTIADTVDARDPGGPGDAERAVLAEMGDPIRLAARYADRPLALIGPALYPAYVRLLTVLLTSVLPVVTVLLMALDLVDGGDAGSAIGAGIGAVFAVGAQLVAWPTAVFALIERSNLRDGVIATSGTWTPDDLPDDRFTDRRSKLAVAAAIWNALLIGAIVGQHTLKPYEVDGRHYEVLDPALWSGWIWPILAGLAGMVTLELMRVGVRGWTVRLAAWYAAATALFALPLAWILYQREFFSPEFVANVKVYDGFYTVAVLGVLVVSVTSVIKNFREVR
ncbi:hypothetical protein [Spirillospora sp. NPDC047279]|uniref:HAAS signaling domain-containing protein n=1 Tax=Spirillospora sp. NPDC047279 TaxID=3155478 RepID=UPI0033DFB2ED